MLTIKNIQERIAFLEQLVHTYQTEIQYLAALAELYRQPHYADVKAIETEVKATTEESVSVHQACETIKRFCSNNVTNNSIIRLTASALSIPVGTFYRAVDVLVAKGYLAKTGTGATYVWKPQQTNATT